MKKNIVLICISLLFIFSAKAQSYLPLFKIDTTEWRVFATGINGVFDSYQIFDYKVKKIGNDTIIYDNYNDSLKISVDSLNSKAWIYLAEFNKKILAYDITLTQTDSFKLYSYYGTQLDSSYLQVDTVYYKNNRKVIEFKIEDNFYIEMNDYPWKFIFIEGVGPINFFRYGYQTSNEMEYPVLIVCKRNLDEIEYEDENSSNCQIEVGIKNVKENTMSVYPNPAADFIYFSKTMNSQEIKIYDNFGTEVESIKGFDTLKQINIKHLPKGIYFIVFKEQNQTFYTKFLKQ